MISFKLKSFLTTSGLLALLFFSGCMTKVKEKSDAVQKNQTILSKQSCDKGQCPCDTPVGSVAHGSKIMVYAKDTVTCKEGCGKYSEELTCNNGLFDKELTGKFFKCEVQECPSCSLGQNLILSGETVEVYKSDMVGCTDSCETLKQLRTCNSGVLSGSDEYKFFSCNRKPCRCALPDNSAFISLNGTIKLYGIEKSTCGKTCETDFAQVRTCISRTTAGVEEFVLDGSSTNRFRTCSEATNCFCTLPNGLGVLAHGQSRTISTAQTVACGETCNAKPSVSVTCDNGQFRNVANLTQVVDFSTPVFSGHKYQCSVEACVSCKVPGTSISILHGNNHRFAKESSAGCGMSCDFKDRACTNGVFAGDITYAAASCNKRPCLCNVSDRPGIQIPVGDRTTFYRSTIAACGQTCAQIAQEKTCSEVVQPDGSYQYEFVGDSTHNSGQCTEATGCSCGLPNALGTIEDGKTVILVNQPSVSCGTRCDEIPSISLKCSNGFLVRTTDGSTVDTSPSDFPYQYYCHQSSCSGCSLPGYGSLPNNTSRTLYDKDKIGCGDQPEIHTFDFKCENGGLLQNGIPYSAANDSAAPPQWFESYILDCPGCPLPWGGSIPEGSKIKGYKYFGTVVNNCGRGCKVSERLCKNGVLQGDVSYNLKECNNSCTLEGGGAPPRVCLLRWQNSFVTPDAQIPMWNKRSVGCGDSCQNHFQLSRCKMERGNFDVPSEYIYPSCTEVCP